jgi:hypothetical protein
LVSLQGDQIGRIFRLLGGCLRWAFDLGTKVAQILATFSTVKIMHYFLTNNILCYTLDDFHPNVSGLSVP